MSRKSEMRALLRLVVLLALAAAAPAPAVAQQQSGARQVCAECHPGRNVHSLPLEGAHGSQVTCVSCHHARSAGAPADAVCAGCHESVQPEHAGVTRNRPACSSCHEIHAPAAARSERTSAACLTCHEAPHALHARPANQPQCTSCHGAHSAEPLSATGPAIDARCQSCHQDAHPSHPSTAARPMPCTGCHVLGKDSAVVGSTQLARTCQGCHTAPVSAHGHASPGTPQCVDCHAFADDPPVANAGPAISQRCGSCHAAALEAYLQGGHARGLSDAPGELPTCVSCHDEHRLGETRVTATAQCIRCHSSERLARKYNLSENVGASYADDFHGATVQLLAQDPSAARATEPVLVCADCHGPHEVGWSESTQLASICISCHERGDERLAGAWLGHARVGPDHQPLIWLVRLFYYFTIPFVLIGLALNIIFHLRDQHRRGARMRDSEGWQRLRARLSGRRLPQHPTVTRFNRGERLEHLSSMSSFILLLLTGLPQTRPDLGIAAAIISLFGGIGTTRLVHRVVGVLFVGLLVLHVARAIMAAFRKRRIPAMVPTRQDFVDTLATLRHFLQGTPRPKVGKFDFSEKFEYWGLFLGGTLMSVTGAILLFPELVTRLLPGELVAMFRVMHGLEATFAVLVVVLWHSYGVILRPEVFPLDTSIFTGKMSVERLKEEHELEYERLFPDMMEAAAHDAVTDGRSEEGAVA